MSHFTQSNNTSSRTELQYNDELDLELFGEFVDLEAEPQPLEFQVEDDSMEFSGLMSTLDVDTSNYEATPSDALPELAPSEDEPFDLYSTMAGSISDLDFGLLNNLEEQWNSGSFEFTNEVTGSASQPQLASSEVPGIFLTQPAAFESDWPLDPDSIDYNESPELVFPLDWVDTSFSLDVAVPGETQPGSSAAEPVVVEEAPQPPPSLKRPHTPESMEDTPVAATATSTTSTPSVPAPHLSAEDYAIRLAGKDKRRRGNKPRVQK